ncbi:FAD/NAD(P)-binding protein [Nocardioides sp. Bht2]|uniref:FAD/NAD(P)-binding protein n=1 Tax=Nocardioides sp. Bht2 TaxID=3392297 RepID=UPI0039B66FD6
MSGREGDRCAVVIGAGAAGTLTAIHLITHLSSRFHVELIDPSPDTGRGPAYSTDDDRHLLNVPASGMSAFPLDPDHFFRYVRAHHDREAQPQDFVPRRVYGDYLNHLLTTATEFPGSARLVRRHATVVDLTSDGGLGTVHLDSGEQVHARAVVLATSARPAAHWAPESLLDSDRLIADPWSRPLRDALPDDGDILLVGTGLTMVDVALAADRPGRRLHTVSRHALVPARHVLPTTPPVPPPPGITRISDLEHLRRVVEEHVARTVRETGDWRAAIDGLRPVTQQLWRGLSDDDRVDFLRHDARLWEIHRHRMPPITARRLDRLRDSGRWREYQGEVVAAEELPDGVRVRLSNGASLEVAAVVNCTGPLSSLAADPLLASLARTGVVRPGPAGMGIDTADLGRVVGTLTQATLFAVGSLRRGNLYESTAMPEIRVQAYNVARAVVRALHGETRQRPTDRYGQALSTSPEVAEIYDQALGSLLRLQEGAEEQLTEAVTLDPAFAQGHAALALLGHEWGTTTTWRQHLARAHEVAGDRHLDERESSFLDAVTTRLRTDEATGAAALLRHIRLFPRDALAVSVAVPTVAFGGLTSGPQTAELVEGLGKAYGDDWWYAGQLAFVRQDQERWKEADELTAYALSVEPASGHAAHARAHVFYETGRHSEGLGWLDRWIIDHGPGANHRSHFSWHAVLHELMSGDLHAARRRYANELAPPTVDGPRALVDAGALLWRARVTGAWLDTAAADQVLGAVDAARLDQPTTPFAAFHAALSLAAAQADGRLAALRGYAFGHSDPVIRELVAPLCDGLAAVLADDHLAAVDALTPVVARARALGGSAAQREVLEDTLITSLAAAGRVAEATALLDQRLCRRPSALDQRRRAALPATSVQRSS